MRPLIRTMASLYQNSQLSGAPVITIPLHIKSTESSVWAYWVKLGEGLECTQFEPSQDRRASNVPS